MAISRIVSQNATGTGTTSATATYPATPKAGNLLIAVVGKDDGTGLASTLTGWASSYQASLGTAPEIDVFYKIAGAGESTTVTATELGATIMNIAIFEYSSFYRSPYVRGIENISQAQTALTAPTGSTPIITTQNSLLIAAAMWPSVAQTISSWSKSFTATNSVAGHLFIADRVVSTSASYTTTCTVTGTSAANIGVIVVFGDKHVDTTSNIGNYLQVADGMSRSEVAN